MYSADELHLRLRRSKKPIAIVVGSALSITRGSPSLGVPDVEGMIERIRARLTAEGLVDHLDRKLAKVNDADRYQAAFAVVNGILDSEVVDEIVHHAVLEARLAEAPSQFGGGDGEAAHWHLPRGTAALGRLVVEQRERFCGPILTTNFDPLISLAIQHAGGQVDRRVLDRDGHLPSTADSGDGVRVIHLHGYWRGSATLHLPQHLTAPRPKLFGSLRELLREHTVLVVGYGGWRDAFMEALAQVLDEPSAALDVLWCFHGDEANAKHRYRELLDKFERYPRFTAYCGVDGHELFDKLARRGRDDGRLRRDLGRKAAGSPRVSWKPDERQNRRHQPPDGPGSNASRSAKPPRVFISYSHDSEEHRARVLELAQRLRQDGVEAWLDRFEPAPPQGWPRWIVEEVQRAEFIVLVCTDAYRGQFERRDTFGQGQMTTFVGLLANQLLFEGELDYERAVPVIFAGTARDAIPLALRSALCHTLPTEYDALLGRLTRSLAIAPEPVRVAESESGGMPDELGPTDRLSLLEDELEQRSIAGMPAEDVREAMLALRRQIRQGPVLEPGDILAGRYRLIEEAGKGGFATVWKGYDRHEQRVVAVKILHGQWARDQSRIDRFESGARRMGSLRHEAVVQTLGAPQHDDFQRFCVMEWYEGGDLHRALSTGAIDRRTALEALARVAMGLAHAHEQDVVHRDVKPANILLDERGRGAISDFDLARAKDSTQGTRTAGLGTFAYAAPEQQEDASRVDWRADVYGLGMSVLFVLAGKDPPAFVAVTNPEFLDKVECSAGLRQALKTSVAYHTDQRTITCEALAAAIHEELRSPNVQVQDERFAPTRRDQPVDVIHVAGVELVRIPAGTFMMGSRSGEGPDDERPQHEVTLASFYLARTSVTNAQYGKYLAANPSAPKPEYWGDRRYNQPDEPVVKMSWEDAQGYCGWAGLVLPTEAQWEYACRAGTTTRYWSGNSEADLARVGWYNKNADGRLHAVAQKEANPFGLFDMHGNVFEWCRDNFGGYTTSPQGREGLRHEPAGVASRVLRGGCWDYTAVVARSACRFFDRPGNRFVIVGFRPAQGHP
jgi:formylglycine-generating enzyme required for sulfatase activity